MYLQIRVDRVLNVLAADRESEREGGRDGEKESVSMSLFREESKVKKVHGMWGNKLGKYLAKF